MGLVIFNNQSSKDYYAEIEAPPTYKVPARDYELNHVPGRNGDLLYDQGSYQNVDVSYVMSIVPPQGYTYAETMLKFQSWLHSGSGYYRLEDSYDPEHYRMACFKNESEIENYFNQAGKLTVTFNCSPGRYLKDGDEPILISDSTLIVNPTEFNAKPFFMVSGSGLGEITIKNTAIAYTMTIDGIEDRMIIDCDIMDCYKDAMNLNNKVSISPVDDFPIFAPGKNYISFSGGVNALVVIPRWWSL